MAYADLEEVATGMGKKFIRGVVNTVTGVIEIPAQTYKGYDKGVGFIKNEPTSKAVGTILGFLRGGGHAAGRVVHGAMETATFWAPNPPDNDGVGIPLDAEFVWEYGDQYSIFKPDLKEGLMPYSRKFLRGIGDVLLGAVEIPGQIVKGVDEEGLVYGLTGGTLKGLWFSAGRCVHGSYEAATFLLPNPVDQLGGGFEDDWPWSALTDTLVY